MFTYTKKLGSIIDFSNYLKIYASINVFPEIRFYLNGNKMHIVTKTREYTINYDKR
jgi:hypothetical protein